VNNRLRFNVLGTFETLDGDGERMDFAHRKAQALLAYLAIERGRPQSRDHLATLLWARTGEERARHNLRQALSKIRTLCPDLIECPGDRIALNASVCLVDATTFQELVRSDDLNDLHLALELYRGDMLEGYSAREPEYQEWLELARGRLRKQAVEVADRLAGLLSEQGRNREAIEVLNRLLRIDMAYEPAHRNLMVLLAREGRRSDALRQYQDCAASLARELDAEPGAETRRVRDEIRRGRSPSLAVPGSPRAPSHRFATVFYADSDRDMTIEEGAGGVVRDSQLQAINRLIGTHGGWVAPLTAGPVLALFNEPDDALTCALNIQLDRTVETGKEQKRFRIGIDCGDVSDDRGEIHGDPVKVATRLEALAVPGGVCVSDQVRARVEGQVNADYQFIGEQRVQQVADPIRAYRAVPPVARSDTTIAGRQPKSRSSLALPGKPSLLIRPFSNMSKDAEQDYFAEGLTKDISIALTKIPGLFLAEDGSPLEQTSRGMGVPELGRAFGVRYVLSGGVRRHGERVRVNAELIDAASSQCLWGERFDRELHDLFSIQDEITEEIVTAMDVKLMQGEAARFMRKALTNPGALDASYRGWYALYHGTGRQGVLEAQHLFEEVIRLEPEAPLGYASAALAYWAEAGFGRVVVHSAAMEHAADLARKALELGDTTGYAHLVMALVHLANQEYDEAMAQATSGVAARPNCNGAYAIKAGVLNFLGRPREAIEFAQYAVRLTPVYPAEFPAVLAAAYHDSNRYTEAIAAARASLQLRNDDIDSMLILAAASVAQGNLDEAREIAATVKRLDPTFRLTEFSVTQPYRNPQDLERLIGRLREAGLPD
jgi:DNA-binding SARP family transcriptional activator/TolB-like protein